MSDNLFLPRLDLGGPAADLTGRLRTTFSCDGETKVRLVPERQDTTPGLVAIAKALFGEGKVVEYGTDRVFPMGFGPNVHVGSGTINTETGEATVR